MSTNRNDNGQDTTTTCGLILGDDDLILVDVLDPSDSVEHHGQVGNEDESENDLVDGNDDTVLVLDLVGDEGDFDLDHCFNH